MKQVTLRMLFVTTSFFITLLTHSAEYTPNQKLHDAAMLGKKDLLDKAFTLDADVNNIHSSTGDTPLHTAVNHRQPFMVAYLLDKKADPNIQNSRGHSALHVLASINVDKYAHEDENIMKKLITIAKALETYGINSALLDQHGLTALARAQWYKKYQGYNSDELIEFLQKLLEKQEQKEKKREEQKTEVVI